MDNYNFILCYVTYELCAMQVRIKGALCKANKYQRRASAVLSLLVSRV